MTPLNNDDRDENGNLVNHYIPIYRSLDLVHWEYHDDVFTAPPEWAARSAELYAPEVRYFNSKYYLYFTVTGTVSPGVTIWTSTLLCRNGNRRDSISDGGWKSRVGCLEIARNFFELNFNNHR
jgi:beta-xylosidase